jgi:hypothetical protein
MRRLFSSLALVAASALVPATSFAQSAIGQVEGFGGITLRGISPSSAFGGSFAAPIGNNVQLIAEGGRMSDLTSGPLALVSDLTPVDFGVSAYYGQGGVRLLGSSTRTIRPYAEATIGIARLHTHVNGFGLGSDGITNTALGFLDSTQPVFGAGAGVLMQGGPVIVDLGYRYQQFGTGNAIQSVLTGSNLAVHQVRMGVGFKF